MSQALQGASFHIEHILPRSLGGGTNAGNLALACPGCNLHKSDRITANDPKTLDAVPLFHPRQELWSKHFRWSGTKILGKTAIGRATVAVLNLNHPRRLIIRTAESGFGLFPPS
jgi:hypothetical protein